MLHDEQRIGISRIAEEKSDGKWTVHYETNSDRQSCFVNETALPIAIRLIKTFLRSYCSTRRTTVADGGADSPHVPQKLASKRLV